MREWRREPALRSTGLVRWRVRALLAVTTPPRAERARPVGASSLANGSRLESVMYLATTSRPRCIVPKSNALPLRRYSLSAWPFGMADGPLAVLYAEGRLSMIDLAPPGLGAE